MAHLELDHTAHVTVRTLDSRRIAADTRNKKRRHVGLKPAAASILGEGWAHNAGLDLRLELGDQLAVPLGFPVHGILQPLDQPLQVSDSRLEPGHTIILFIDRRASVRCVSAGRRAANLADSCDQSLALTHDHRLPDRFGGALRGG
ncbi:MAG: hypothetical protein WCD11_19695 [Solirubrobacteraceae bacterium]